jgi:dipeptidyl aminopeptidase/acylaminoacyl peptidase
MIAMKRALLIFIVLLLFTSGYVAASCSNRQLEYGDSCEGDYEPRNNLILYTFDGEEGDVVTITLTWEDDVEGSIILVGPVVDLTQVEYDVQEQISDDDGEVVLEEIELPEDGAYAFGVSFDDDATYEVLFENGSGGGDEEDDSDLTFLDDTVLIFQSTEIPTRNDEGYFYSSFAATSDGVELLVDTDDNQYSTGCGTLSPDGTRFLYTTNEDGNGESDYTHFEIYSARADGSRGRRLTETEADEITPRWSPDGERIVFMASEEPDDIDTYEIFVMDADGDNLEQITDNNDGDRFPSWSPDGELIIFHSNRDGDDYDLYTMTPEGEDVQQLTENDWNDARAMYSPDGEQIVFNANRFGYDDLFIMDADGDNIERLTESEDNFEFGAIWSPDGTMLAFTSNQDVAPSPNEVWVMNADGSEMQAIFADPDFDFALCDWGIIDD